MKAADTFPMEKGRSLATQVRRAAISVPSNIAEGFGRGTPTDFQRFLRIARASLFELDTQMLIAKELGFLSTKGHASLMDDWTQLSKVLAGLIRSSRSRPGSPRKGRG